MRKQKNMRVTKTFIIVIVITVLLAVGIWGYFSWRAPHVPTENNPGKNVQEQLDKPIHEEKQFVFTEFSGSGVTGDGTATLTNDLTSIGVRLVQAPQLKFSEVYECYVYIKEGTDPQLVGTFVGVSTKHEKFLTGGAGPTSWYGAEKVVVTRRTKDEARPGTVVAEGTLR